MLQTPSSARPGTDAALALGLGRVIVDAGLHDAQFVEAHTHGFGEYRQRLAEFRSEGRLVDRDRAGRDRALALEYAGTKPRCSSRASAFNGTPRGPDDAGRGAAAALTGNVGILAAGGSTPISPAIASARSRCRQSRPPRARSGVAGGPSLETLDAPPIRAAWIERGNPRCRTRRRTAFAARSLASIWWSWSISS